MQVSVVMSNDFPDCVFAHEADAEKYCKEQNDAQQDGRPFTAARIYYRQYVMEVLLP